MQSPDSTSPGVCSPETGAHQVSYRVAPVSFMWLSRLAEIDSSWNPRPWSEQLFREELASQVARVQGLFIADELIGYAIAHVVCDEAHIVSFGITPELRGRGAGTYLLRSLLRSLEAERVRVVTLEVRLSNSSAQALYEKVGFDIVAVRRRYYYSNNEDALMMRMELQGSGE